MNRKNSKIKASTPEKSNKIVNSSVDVSYKEKNTVIDLSFPHLFDCVEFNDFSNKFRLPKDYIEYIHYLNSVIFKNISDYPCNDVFTRKEIFEKHTHTLGEKEYKLVKDILINSFMNHHTPYHSASKIVEQNINDVTLFQIGFENDKGRVIGYFKENVFKPVLLDPHHLIYKTEIGKIRRFNNIKNNKFQPKDISSYHIEKACICCGKDAKEKLFDVCEDEILKETIYICEECLTNLLNS